MIKWKNKSPFSWIFLVLSVMGLITFSLFILEESCQLCVFSNFAAVDAEDWGNVKDNNDVLRSINSTLDTINRFLGWIQPLSYVSYKAWSRATHRYLTTLDALAFAHQPELFEGRVITFYFKPKEIKRGKYGYMLINGKVVVQMKDIPELPVLIKGKVVVRDKKVIIQVGRK